MMRACACDERGVKKAQTGKRLFLLIVYVDDILTYVSKQSLYQEWFAWFDKEFNWTNFDTNLHEFTSVCITQTHGDQGKVTLDMNRYIQDMVDEHFPAGIHHHYNVPADTDLTDFVYKASCIKNTDYSKTDLGKRFRRLCMQLLYCSYQARPDISISVGLLTRVQAYPSPELLKRAERVLIYLAGTLDIMLTYTAQGLQYYSHRGMDGPQGLPLLAQLTLHSASRTLPQATPFSWVELQFNGLQRSRLPLPYPPTKQRWSQARWLHALQSQSAASLTISVSSRLNLLLFAWTAPARSTWQTTQCTTTSRSTSPDATCSFAS